MKMLELEPAVSVITVCYNAEQEIKKTIDSILSQSAIAEIELIIIDGGSNDSTLDIINKCSIEKFLNARFILKSEKDYGVYDAMNKGASLASGKWIIYMNAGDSFCDCEVVKDFIQYSRGKKAIAIYGNTICQSDQGDFFQEAEDIHKIVYKKPFCHQSIFVLSKIQKKYKFNCKYKIQSDYDMFLRIYRDSYDIEKWNRTVSVFSTDGMSSNPLNYNLIFKELIKLHKENGENIFNTPILVFYYIKSYLKIIKYKVVKLLECIMRNTE